MTALKRHFFLSFCVMGCYLPFLAKLLSDRGLTDAQVGYVLSGHGVAVCISPWLMATMADLGIPTRKLLSLCLLGTGVFGYWLGQSNGFAWMYGIHLLMYLAWVPVVPLQDSLFFNTQAKMAPDVDYTRVRVWGTVGFIAASIGLWLLLTLGQGKWDIGMITIVGGVAAGLGVMNGWTLPNDHAPGNDHAQDNEATSASAPVSTAKAKRPRRQKGEPLPLFEALAVCVKPPLACYLIGQWLLAFAVFAFYAFQPLYLAKTVGFEDRWLGLIIGFGVVFEIAWVLAMPKLIRVMGQKRMIVIGSLVIAVRFALMFWFPTKAMAIWTQLLHGPMVVVMHVLPPTVLNHHSPSHARGSIQGVYTTGILGSARLVTLAAAGNIAGRFQYTGVMAASAVACLLAAVLFATTMPRSKQST